MLAGQRELDGDASLDGLVQFEASTQSQRQEILPAHARRAEVEQVRALEVQVMLLASGGVVKPVQFHKRVDMVAIQQVVVQMEAAEEVIGPLAVHGKGVARRVQEVEVAHTRPAELLAEADVGLQRQVTGILEDLGIANGK